MNSVTLIGRLTRDPETRYTSDTQTAVTRFSIAISRGKDKNGNDKGADFPNVTVFGKQAENCEKYLKKGRMVAVQGRLQTGSYEKNGQKVYTTDVIADRVEFLGGNETTHPGDYSQPEDEPARQMEYEPEGFSQIQEDIPF